MDTWNRIQAARRRAAVLAFAGLMTAILLGGCAHEPARPAASAPPKMTPPPSLGALPAQFAGTLPCGEGCDGIALWLTLGAHGVYVLQQHYNTHDDTPDYVEVGRWQANAGGERLSLTPADSDETGASLWAVAGPDSLIALDGDGATIAPVADYTLHRRQNMQALPFADTQWYLVNAPDAHHGGDAYIRFDGAEHRLTGSTGCNRLMGDYNDDDDGLVLSKLASSRRACLSFEDTEQSMLEALRQTRRARVLANYLLLFGPAGDRSPLAIFQAETDAMPLSH